MLRRPSWRAPQLHENPPPNNRRLRMDPSATRTGPTSSTDAAEVVVRQRLVNQRLIPELDGNPWRHRPVQTRHPRITIWMSSQTPHIQRLLLTAFVTGIPEHKLRCISPDVGGAFGTKIFCYADMALVMFASKLMMDARSSGSKRGGRTTSRQLGSHHRDRGRGEGGHRSPRRPSPTSAAGSLRSAPAFRRPSTGGSPPAATTSRMSTAKSPGSTRTRPSSMPIGAPVGRRRPTSSNGRWTCSPTDRHGSGGNPSKNFLPRRVPVRKPIRAGHGRRWRQDFYRLGQLRARDG